MTTLGILGLLMMFAPVWTFIIERGGFEGDDDADLVHWLAKKSLEQILLLQASIVSGAALVTASLMQGAWKL